MLENDMTLEEAAMKEVKKKLQNQQKKSSSIKFHF